MFHPEYPNIDTTKGFVHVMGWEMTDAEFTQFIPKLVIRIAKYGRQVSMFFMPAKQVEGFKSCGMSCNVQCHPNILQKLREEVEFIRY